MFDMLTRDELHELHGTLCSQHTRQHRIIMGLMDLNRAGGGDIAVLLASPPFRVLDASHREIDEMAAAVYAELGRRAQESLWIRHVTNCNLVESSEKLKRKTEIEIREQAGEAAELCVDGQVVARRIISDASDRIERVEATDG